MDRKKQHIINLKTQGYVFKKVIGKQYRGTGYIYLPKEFVGRTFYIILVGDEDESDVLKAVHSKIKTKGRAR